MRLLFDRGTLVFDQVPDGVDLSGVRGVRFDPRIGAWRARAFEREMILLELMRRGVDVVDETMRALGPPHAVSVPALRPYQAQALLAWEGGHRRGVVVMPTGAGKTRVALAAIARLACRTLVLAPTRVLVDQWRANLRVAGVHDVGQYGDGRHEMAAITVATMDGAWRAMHVLGDAFELVIVDEVHQLGSLRSEALEMSLAPFRLGLTATMPDADSTSRITRLVGPVLHTSTLDELAGSFLSPFDLVVVHTELNRDERNSYESWMARFKTWADDERFVEPEITIADLAKRAMRSAEGRAAFEALRFAQKILAYPTQKRAALAALLDEHRARKLLVFTGDNKTAYTIAREHLIPPMTGHVSRAERAETLARFRDGTLRALVSAQVLNEGVDVPDADVAVVVGGRAGEREHVQRIGRVLRPAEGKRALVVELVVPRSTESKKGVRRRSFLNRSGVEPSWS